MKPEGMPLHAALLVFVCLVSSVLAATPVCVPTSLSVTLGTNTTANTILGNVSCTDSTAGHTISYSIDTSTDGYTYFSMNDSNLVLANRLDVEFGGNTWNINILATDNGTSPLTAMVPVTLTTYQSTTTTTTTPAPPGYSWFDRQENVILLGVTAAVTALTIATCILLCWRFHRIGTCLPKNCPEYRDCKASFSRNVNCCPIPCSFGPTPDIDEEKVAALPSHAQQETFGTHGVGIEAALKTSELTEKKETAGKKSKTPQKPSGLPQGTKSKDDDEENVPDRRLIVSPVVIGNVNLKDVGFDGMRSPGFNAPMFTTYGGKNNRKPQLKKY